MSDKENRSLGREATLKQRIRVIQKRALGMFYRAIGADVGLSKDAALKICRDWDREEKVHSAPRSGRPPKLSERNHLYLRRVVARDSFAPFSEIATVLPRVSTHTVSRALMKDDLCSHIARKKPYLTAQKMKRKLKWPKL